MLYGCLYNHQGCGDISSAPVSQGRPGWLPGPLALPTAMTPMLWQAGEDVEGNRKNYIWRVFSNLPIKARGRSCAVYTAGPYLGCRPGLWCGSKYTVSTHDISPGPCTRGQRCVYLPGPQTPITASWLVLLYGNVHCVSNAALWLWFHMTLPLFEDYISYHNSCILTCSLFLII